jgi:hypothetical protein
MLRKYATVVIALSCVASTVQAQFPGSGMPGSSRPISLVISGGLTLPAGDLGDFHDSGFHYDASLLVTIPGFPLAIRPEFSLTQLKLKEPIVTTPGADDVTNMMAFMGNLELPLGGGLYVLAGGGILSLSAPDALTGSGEESSKKFKFDAGAGFRFALGGMRGFVEGRIGSASYDAGKVGFSKAQFIPITFGLVF